MESPIISPSMVIFAPSVAPVPSVVSVSMMKAFSPTLIVPALKSTLSLEVTILRLVEPFATS